MLELQNLGFIIVVNAVFAFPITTGVFQFFRVIGNEIKSEKKREMRWVVFISLMVLSTWFYLVFSSLFHWQF
jgi:hypothetical protein